MSVIDDLITDRTQADVNLVNQLAALGRAGQSSAQRQQWAGNLKGAYNASDMNRVGQAVNYLVTQLNAAHQYTYDWMWDSWLAWDEFWSPEHWEPNWIYPLNITAKTDWAETDIPTQEQLATYLQNVDTATSSIAIARNLPASMERLTFDGANAIEQALRNESVTCNAYIDYMEELMEKANKAWYYSGDLYGGEI